jgi:hypothetical protein
LFAGAMLTLYQLVGWITPINGFLTVPTVFIVRTLTFFGRLNARSSIAFTSFFSFIIFRASHFYVLAHVSIIFWIAFAYKFEIFINTFSIIQTRHRNTFITFLTFFTVEPMWTKAGKLT